MGAFALARALGVPATALAFLEGQFPEVRAIRTDGHRTYRLSDAVFLAGLAEALYGEGLPFREVQEQARSGGRAELMQKGAARLGLDVAAIMAPEPQKPIPQDAIVQRKAGVTLRPAPSSADTEDVLRELMACVRILGAARQDGPR
ncbi:MAG: hypothetical protein AAFW98_04365 [Pseudomonadota bacterium]